MEDGREERIVASILLRKGVNVEREVLKDMVLDCLSEVQDFINYKEDMEVPMSLDGVIKELVLTKINKEGVEGIQSESLPSGHSTSYLQDMTPQMKRRLYKYRKMQRR